jgi:putative transposase
MSLIRNAFKRLHYPADVIAQCVRWYLAYALSLRNLEEMMAERGIFVDHSTVIRLVPLLDKAFRRHKRSVGRRWRMDETYIKIKGQWKYLYRAVDTSGQTIDFLLTAKRDAAAAQRFFRKAICHHGEPEVVTIDKSGANTAALGILNAGKPDEETITIRQSKYLNNLVEQAHRNIKRRVRLMLGFKSFRRSQTILAGIELIHMIRKGQFHHPTGDGGTISSVGCVKSRQHKLCRPAAVNATEPPSVWW